VSEMLLRKTRAESAESIVKSLLDRYPTVTHLAAAPTSKVKRIINPLGLQTVRSVALKRVANLIIAEHGSKVPSDISVLSAFPHVGRYSANAVGCFAFGKRLPIVDANIVRIYSRAFGTSVPGEVHKADDLWEFAKSMLPKRRYREYNWALLDLGAMVCTSSSPQCKICPVRLFCKYLKKA